MSEVSSTPSRPTTPANNINALTSPTPQTARAYRFTWDPSSRKPGPESVSGTTEGRGAADFYTTQSGLTPFPLGVLNSSSTTNLALSALPTEWSSSKHGFHAISTVLNNPHKKQAPPKAHSSLPTVPPADLPRVRRKDFDGYLRAMSSEWEKFQKNDRIGREGQARLDSNNLSVSNMNEDDITPRPSFTSDPNVNAQQSFLTPSMSTSSYASGSGGSGLSTPIQQRTIPPLETVPSVFFEQDFNLGDPRTFAQVTEQSLDHSNGGIGLGVGVGMGTGTGTETGSNSGSNYINEPTTSTSTTSTISHNTPPLLDKFSHYLDTVEQHLVREISIRSTSFFAALTNLQDLQSESDVCLDRIGKLRGLLKDVDEKTAKKGMEIVKRDVKVGNLENVKVGVWNVREVVEMTGVVKGLVGSGQFGEALNVVEDLERMWDGKNEEGVDEDKDKEIMKKVGNGKLEMLEEATEDEDEDKEYEKEKEKGKGKESRTQSRKKSFKFPLSALNAFSELPNHLRVLTLEIASSLSRELIGVLQHDLEERLNQSIGSDKNKVNGRTRKGEELKDRLKPLLQNLVRTKGLKDAILSWEQVVVGEVRRIVKARVPEFEKEWDEEKDENKTTLIEHLKNMQHTEFMPLLQGLYKQLLALIEGVQAQNNIINTLLESLIESTKPNTSNHLSIPNISEDLTHLLTSITELTNTQSSKFIHYRAEQHAYLPLPQFLTLYYDSMAFVVKCEVICRRMIIGLRGVVVRQASLFLSKFHQGRIERCARVVLDETWRQVDVKEEIQNVVDVLVDSAVKDAEELKLKVEDNVFGSGGQGGIGNGSATSTLLKLKTLPLMKTIAELNETESALTSSESRESNTNKGPAVKGAKHLRIDDRSYYLVSATAEVVVLLIDYLKIVVNLSTLTKDTISKVVEFLMTFNSRTCQLVLGAGAMRSAGLRHITAKHLALASQSLSIVSELIPYVRETFRRHLNQAEAVLLVDFDKLKRDYQVHQTEVHAKLITIMGDRLTAHIESFRSIDWNQPGPGDGRVNQYMQTLVEETVTLHRVLSRYLSAAVVEYVMSEVFAGINHRLSETYGTIELPSQDAKDRLLADAKFLNRELSRLKNVVAPMGMLETVVSEKSVPRANVQPVSPAPSLTRSNTLSANQRLRGLLSRSSTVASGSNNNQGSPALPVPYSASPRNSLSSPPPTIPPKSPSGSINFTQNVIASVSTLALGSEPSTSQSSLRLSSPPPTSTLGERVFTASPPPMNGNGSGGTKSDGMSVVSPELTPETLTSVEVETSPQIDGQAALDQGLKTPVGISVEASLPEFPSNTERTSDMKEV